FYFFTTKPQRKNSKKDFFFRIIPFRTEARLLRSKRPPEPTTAHIGPVPPPGNPSGNKSEINAKSIRFRFGT
ncbi:hypothetical protein, partial [Alistipes finegoldii]|uniref:hypothetical protein n=2 Tax=Alistipes finegoldii TaxID=214856 RepID=UPI003AB8042C